MRLVRGVGMPTLGVGMAPGDREASIPQPLHSQWMGHPCDSFAAWACRRWASAWHPALTMGAALTRLLAMSAELPYEYENSVLHERRERVFLILAGLFLGTLAMLNILGISRFIDLSFTIPLPWKPWEMTIPFMVAVGVLPYPMTFLCTDFISELYGRRRANFVVWIGLVLNVWVVFILWLGSALPGSGMDPATGDVIRDAAGRVPVFFEVKTLAFGAVTASMIAYLAAQFCDVHVFHFWKRLTKGKHLWLRNNGSTLISQIVDTTAVILITHYYAHALPVNHEKAIFPQLMTFIVSGYVFKMVAALLDTVPFYVGVHYLSKFLKIDPQREHAL